MCVTSGPAKIDGTSAFTYSIYDPTHPQAVHITGYQNHAENLGSGPNCMLLHFPAHDIKMVSGPEQTRHFMRDLTTGLPEIMPIYQSRGVSDAHGTATFGARVEEYGDYHVVLAQSTHDILDALEEVPEHRRPEQTSSLEQLAGWYQENFPDYAFVLACFNGSVKSNHPIVVEYIPFSDDVLFVPGLEGHDGNIPLIGEAVPRDFRVAYAVQGHELPISVNYSEPVASQRWAPSTVTGFFDNRITSPNTDYVIPLETIEEGFCGPELIEELVS